MASRKALTDRSVRGKFGPVQRKKFLDRLEKYGNVRDAASHVGITTATVYTHMKKNESLKQAVEVAKDRAAREIEREIHRRAIEGIEEDVYFQGDVVGTQIRYSDKLLELMARANLPEYGRVADNLGRHAQPQINVNIVNGETKSKLADLLGVTVDNDSGEVVE